MDWNRALQVVRNNWIPFALASLLLAYLFWPSATPAPSSTGKPIDYSRAAYFFLCVFFGVLAIRSLPHHQHVGWGLIGIALISLLLAVGIGHPLNTRMGIFWDSILNLQGIALVGLAALAVYGIYRVDIKAVRVTLYVALAVIVLKFTLPIITGNVNLAKTIFKDLSGFDFSTSAFLAVIAGIFFWKTTDLTRVIAGIILACLILSAIGNSSEAIRSGATSFWTGIGSPDIDAWTGGSLTNIKNGWYDLSTAARTAIALAAIILFLFSFSVVWKAAGRLALGIIVLASVIFFLWLITFGIKEINKASHIRSYRTPIANNSAPATRTAPQHLASSPEYPPIAVRKVFENGHWVTEAKCGKPGTHPYGYPNGDVVCK